MIIIGITGGIGMGKSLLTRQCALLGAKTCSSDAVVHQLLEKGGKAVEAVAACFPGVKKNGAIDRKALGAVVFADREKRARLEAILHPMVFAEEKSFAHRQRKLGAALVVFDIPLLFETGGESRCDITITAAAPTFLQRRRVMARQGMTQQKFSAIAASQMREQQKRQRADFVVQTGLGKGYSMRQLKIILSQIHA